TNRGKSPGSGQGAAGTWASKNRGCISWYSLPTASPRRPSSSRRRSASAQALPVFRPVVRLGERLSSVVRIIRIPILMILTTSLQQAWVHREGRAGGRARPAPLRRDPWAQIAVLNEQLDAGR